MEKKNKLNLGCVVYTEIGNGIEATWIFNQNGEIQRGIGIGTRISKQKFEHRFEGEFEISYSDQNGNKSPSLTLIITYNTGVYNLTWKKNGATTDLGIGMIVDDKLLASYAEIMRNDSGF